MSEKHQNQALTAYSDHELNKHTEEKQAALEAPSKSGLTQSHVKIDMDWKEAIGKALKKERPKDGWP